jgi:hypothetical protein
LPRPGWNGFNLRPIPRAFHDLEHVWPGKPIPDKTANRLYSSWVSDISIEKLLATDDLENGREAKGVKSLLCSDVLNRIAKNAFDLKGPVRVREWIGRDNDRSLRVFLTLSNLRGVPYSFSLFGREERFGMLNHGDYLDFKIGLQPAECSETHALNVENFSDPSWELFRTGVLATGAFPVGLVPRQVQRQPSDYRNSQIVGFDQAGEFKIIAPDSSIEKEQPYQFVSTDGGVINNEPLELARRYLAGGPGKFNEQDGDSAKRAVILVAPFPNFASVPKYEDGETILDIVPKLMSTLINQARFKPDELAKAANDTIFSRFMISPSRVGGSTEEAKKYPIASGALGGFSGFLHESFRRHDYLLGRRNAQAFLRWTFALPASNHLFDDFQKGRDEWRDEWYVCDTRGAEGSIGPAEEKRYKRKTFARKVNGEKDTPGLPIIPLVGRLREPIEIEEPDLPKPNAINIEDLQARLIARAGKVVGTLVDIDLYEETRDMLFGGLLREGARHYGAQVASQTASRKVRDAIQDVAKAFDRTLS